MAYFGGRNNARNSSYGRRTNGRRSTPRPNAAPQAQDAAAAAGAVAQAIGNESACDETAAQLRTCCDMYRGCHQFIRCSRDRFWPNFAHPRWLPCRKLYRSGEIE